MDFSKLTEWLKLKPRYLVALGIASGLLLFLPDRFLLSLGLSELSASFRPWIGGVFLLSTVLLLTHFLSKIGTPVQEKIEEALAVRGWAKRLKELTPEEKAHLQQYIQGNTQTRYYDLSDGVVKGLVAKKILYRATSLGQGEAFAYNMQPWAWRRLKKRPDILALNGNEV